MASRHETCPYCGLKSIINLMHFRGECGANPEKDKQLAGELLMKYFAHLKSPSISTSSQTVAPPPQVVVDPEEERRRLFLERDLNSAPKTSVGDRQLASNQLHGDHPPASHAVVDWEVLDDDAETYNPLSVRYAGHIRTEGNFSFHRYQVGGFAVFVVWPKGWVPPGPNRFGWLPQRTFGATEGQFDVKQRYQGENPQPDEIWYRTIEGKHIIRNFP